MNKKTLIAILPIMLALTLTGCDSKSTVEPAPTTPVAIAETPQPIPTVETAPLPVEAAPLPEVAVTTPTDAELTDVVKSYNQEVDASNNKAKEVLENYTGQIESVTGK